MAAMAFGIVATGDTESEAIRHLYSFQALCDLILVADLVWLARALGFQSIRVPHAETRLSIF